MKIIVPFCTQGKMARMETTTLRMSVELMYTLLSVQLASWTNKRYSMLKQSFDCTCCTPSPP